MGDNPFRDTQEASDARFNASYIPAKNTAPIGQVLADAAERIEAFKGSELSFSFPHTGGVFTRLARASLSDFEGLDLIDLRMLRAHLDEASFLVANAIARHEQQR